MTAFLQTALGFAGPLTLLETYSNRFAPADAMYQRVSCLLGLGRTDEAAFLMDTTTLFAVSRPELVARNTLDFQAVLAAELEMIPSRLYEPVGKATRGSVQSNTVLHGTSLIAPLLAAIRRSVEEYCFEPPRSRPKPRC